MPAAIFTGSNAAAAARNSGATGDVPSTQVRHRTHTAARIGMNLSTHRNRSPGSASGNRVISATLPNGIPVILWIRKFDIPRFAASTTIAATAS